MIDRFGRNINYLRISVTDRCNLRCCYCMPEDGVCKKRHEDMLTQEEMLTAVKAAAALGVTTAYWVRPPTSVRSSFTAPITSPEG